MTFHTADNFGAVLQAYALQKYLSDNLNNIVEIIDYHTKEHDRDNMIFKKNTYSLIIRIIYYFFTLIRLPSLMLRRKRYNQFRKDYYNLSKRFSCISDIEKLGNQYDIVISGSDQVFNPYIRDSAVYYLSKGFNNVKKVAYAPSFGVSDFSLLSKAQITSLLNFNNLSCREQIGADFLTHLKGIEIPCVLDPTFLLKKTEWLKLSLPPSISNYIFVYELNGGNDLIRLAKRISEQTRLPIICSTTRVFLFSWGYTIHFDLGPSEILGYIQNARYVVTDSFHGTALSLIMEVKVIPYIAFSSTSSRLYSLMKQFGLENNIVKSLDDFNMNQLNFKDYSDEINLRIEQSKEYLQNAIYK